MSSERKRETDRAHKERNRERINARRRELYAADPERFRAQSRGYYERNAELIREAHRLFRIENPERAREIDRRHREGHSEERNAYTREWLRNNPEWVKSYRVANPEKGPERSARWRARRKNAPAVEQIDRVAIIARDRSRCHICGKRVPASQIHLDHIVPLARGGEHTARNLAVAHASCNVRKGAGAANDQLRLVG